MASANDSVASAHLLDRLLVLRESLHAACVSEQGTVTYAELCTRVEKSAAALAAYGVDSGTIVAFDAIRSAETIALMLAVLHRGAAYLPLDPALPAERRNQIIEDAKPDLIVDMVENPIVRGTATAPRTGELAYVLFTSGSTGRPKGVAMRTGSVAALIDWHVSHPRLGKPARTLQFAPITFDVSFQEIASTFATGGTLILPTEAQRRDPWALLDLIERERIERVFMPYVALQSIAEAVASDQRATPASLVDVITAGEQLRITPAIRALFAALPNCTLHNHYGPTETHVVTAHELSGDSAHWPELPSIGMPLPHAQIRIGEAGSANEGELYLGGECLAQGYINRPELTAERFVNVAGQRWYRTGDNVRRSADGSLDYLGRIDDQIKLAGYRIEPAEIETVIGKHAQVAQVVVVAVGEAAEKRLVAHIVPRDSATTPHNEFVQSVRELCERWLAAYMVPQEFAIHAMLPLTASGKIDRHRLARAESQVAIEWSEHASLDQQVSALWKQLLGVAKLDASANIFDQGARSLTVVQALTELRRRGHVMSVAQVYEHPTVAAQVALLRAPRIVATTSDEGRGEKQRAALSRFAKTGAR